MSFRLLEVKILESNLTSLGSLCSRQDFGYPARRTKLIGSTTGRGGHSESCKIRAFSTFVIPYHLLRFALLIHSLQYNG